jgi:plasmid maintenance system killer protein
MQVNISDKDLEELILTGKNNKYKLYSKDKRFMKGLARAYKIMQIVANAEGLRPYSFLHYEKLAHKVNLSSVRVMNGRVERLLFNEINDGIEITIIELNSNHYGNKK